MNAAAHRLADGFRSVIGYLSPTPTISQFLEKGTLTPAEFVQAGDQLAFKFPTWSWQGVEGRRQVGWLPPSKQYLITYGVSCRARVRDLDASMENSLSVTAPGGGAPWLLPFFPADATPVEAPAVIEDALPDENACPSEQRVEKLADGADSTGRESKCIDDLVSESDDVCMVQESSDLIHVTRTRSYDLSITYDKYYQTPRLWLKGYDEEGFPLEAKCIFEDILTDYVAKTVTIDPHPCTGELTVSIHPCRHAAMMKKVVDGWVANKVQPRADLALIVLLKFISSVIPTIQYDTTLDIDGFSLHV